jgi:shikimate dehydrogenase
MINTETKLFAILGYPVRHSFSPQMHNEWFRKENLNSIYLAFEPEPKDLKKAVESLKFFKFCGANVTIPHKTDIIKYIDFVDKVAEEIGSINTIVAENGRFCGYNTDYLGFSQDLSAKKVNLKSKNVLIIGAGGVARAVAYALKNSEAEKIYIASRTLKNARRLASTFKLEPLDINKVNELLPDVDLLVNASSCGMKETDVLPFNAVKVKKSLIVYDLICGKATPFVKLAKDEGLRIFTGEGMLVRQGACGFKMWTGVCPDIKIAEELLKNLLSNICLEVRK